MIQKVLVANRGEIALRIMRTCFDQGIKTVAVYSDADRHAPHVKAADEAVHIGASPAAESYLLGDRVLAAAKQTGADAIHPGYGFLSENADFADAVAAADMTFIGPPADAIRAMGSKSAAKAMMEAAGVPVLPGYHGDAQDLATLSAAADRIGYPVLIKAVAGGGGKGMRLVEDPAGFSAALEGAQREGANSFGNAAVLIEKYLGRPRHIEIQVFADHHGNVVHLFERDCSLQRRHQKVVEEAPAPDMPADLRRAMGEAACRAAATIGYVGAGTVEFLVDADQGLHPDAFYFMEMNTRLQVEHPVTEMITGTDLVAWQLAVAAGEPLPLAQDALAIDGHAVEARIYAEDPMQDFLPQTGPLFHCETPPQMPGLRIDTGVEAGGAVTSFYDPMIAKVICHGATRDQALQKLAHALDGYRLQGLRSNLDYVTAIARHPAFIAGKVDTGFLARHADDLAEGNSIPDRVLGLAAAALTCWPDRGGNPAGDATSPWGAQDGWRIGGARHEQVTLSWRDHDITLEIEQRANDLTMHFEGRSCCLEDIKIDDGKIFAICDGQQMTGFASLNADALWLDTAGKRWLFQRHNPLLEAASDGSTNGDIEAPLPGRIVKVSVTPGQQVAADAVLVVMEAMKMEHSLTAAAPAVVADVLVTEGDLVQDGDLLVAFKGD